MPLLAKLFLCLLAAVPGIVWSLLGALLFRGEYFYPTYMAGGSVMVMIAMLAMLVLLGFMAVQARRWRVALAVAAAILLGWLAALPVMALLNLTPLCVGQNNGDGINDVGLCIGYVVLYALVYTPMILLGSIPLSLIAAGIRPGTEVKAL